MGFMGFTAGFRGTNFDIIVPISGTIIFIGLTKVIQPNPVNNKFIKMNPIFQIKDLMEIVALLLHTFGMPTVPRTG